MNYRKLWEKCYGPIPVDEQGRKYEIHHVDGNRKNNSIENLKCVSIEEHYRIHQEQGDGIACHAIKLRMQGKPLKGWHHSEKMKQKFSEDRKGKKRSFETIEKIRLVKTGTKLPAKVKDKISAAHKIPIMHKESGVVFESGKLAAKVLGVTPGTIIHRIKKGEFIYITEQEYQKGKKHKTFLQIEKYSAHRKKVRHEATGQVFKSVADAAKVFNISPSNMNYYIRKRVFSYI